MDSSHDILAILPNLYGMFTTYAIDLNSQQDTQASAETLEEALTQLRKLVASEIEDPAGPRFDRYGITIDKEAWAREHANNGLSDDACASAECLAKHHDVDAAFALGTLAEILCNDLYDLYEECQKKSRAAEAELGYSDDSDEANDAWQRQCQKNATAARRKCVMTALIRKVEAAHHKLQAEVLERHDDEDFSADWASRARKQAKAAGMILVLMKHALEYEYQGLAGGDDDDDGDDE